MRDKGLCDLFILTRSMGNMLEGRWRLTESMGDGFVHVGVEERGRCVRRRGKVIVSGAIWLWFSGFFIFYSDWFSLVFRLLFWTGFLDFQNEEGRKKKGWREKGGGPERGQGDKERGKGIENWGVGKWERKRGMGRE